MNKLELTKRTIDQEVITTKQELIEKLIKKWYRNPKLPTKYGIYLDIKFDLNK